MMKQQLRGTLWGAFVGAVTTITVGGIAMAVVAASLGLWLLLVSVAANAMDMDDAKMLNEWRKEIVRLQYTDFCNSIKPLSPQALQVLQQVIAQGKEAKHPVADELEAFFGRIGEQYAAKGCGDA